MRQIHSTISNNFNNSSYFHYERWKKVFLSFTQNEWKVIFHKKNHDWLKKNAQESNIQYVWICMECKYIVCVSVYNNNWLNIPEKNNQSKSTQKSALKTSGADSCKYLRIIYQAFFLYTYSILQCDAINIEDNKEWWWQGCLYSIFFLLPLMDFRKVRRLKFQVCNSKRKKYVEGDGTVLHPIISTPPRTDSFIV